MNAQVPPKVDPESVALRAAPRAVTRLNRRVLMVLAVVVVVAVFGATLWSLRPHPRQHVGSPAEQYNVDRVTRAEDLDKLPEDYSKMAPPVRSAVPELGPPLPGDLGPPIVRAQRAMGRSGLDDPARTEKLDRQREVETAVQSSVFFRGGEAKAAPVNEVAAVATPATPASPSGPFDAVPPPAQAADPTAVQNRQDQKEAFVAKAGDTATRNTAALQAPASPYTVMAGTIIPAALVTGINSDLPGQVIATVTESVYDTAIGRYLLIPQGSRLIGRYDSQVAFGQRRVLLVWTRLILPDTSSIALDRLPGIDPEGYAGLEDGVDWHWGRILEGVVLSTLLGVSAEEAVGNTGDSNGSVVLAVRNSAQDSVNQVGQEITRRNLGVQPTLTVRPGFPMRVMVNKDLVLRPYQPLFFQRGSSQ
jgi:type IV secretion system protein VirB10